MFGDHESYTLQDLSVNLYTSGNIYTAYNDDLNLFASGWAGAAQTLNPTMVAV